MNISSLNNYGSYFKVATDTTNRINSYRQTATAEPSQTSSAIYRSSDGDTLELTGNQTDLSTVYHSYGPPPAPPPNQTNSQSDTTDADSIKAFLDKVANGTATADDLAAIQVVFQEMQQQHANGSYQPFDSSVGESDRTSRTGTHLDTAGTDQAAAIKSFLDKVAAGTATEGDVADMQTMLWQTQRPIPRGFAESGSDDAANPAASVNPTNSVAEA